MIAPVAQMVEQPLCKRTVGGSNPSRGTRVVGSPGKLPRL